MNLFSKTFWATALENMIQTGASTFSASGFFTSGHPTLKGLAAAGIAAGMAALYTFIKQLGAKQVLSALSALAKGGAPK